MIRRLQSKLRPVHGVAVTGAWAFIVVSLAQLVWACVTKLAEPSATVTLLETSAMGTEHQALGLTYAGWGGLLQVLFQLAVVATAVLLSRLRLDRPRRIGHVALVGWAALWALNAHRLAGLDGHVGSTLEAGLLTALLGCTLYRAGAGWRRTAPNGAVSTVETPIDETVAEVPCEDGPPTVEDPPAPASPVGRAIDAARRFAATTRRTTVRLAQSDAALRARAGARTGARRVGEYLRDKGVIAGSAKSASS